jgi:organic hydroperoxide reductase OsmC/OhrA
VATRAKRLSYEIEIDRAGRVSAEDCPPLDLPDEWQAEHLLLAGLARCSLTSLRYHAHRIGADSVGSGGASGIVTKRESDGRYAFVEIEARLDVEIEPEPADLAELLGKAERDCFIAASLTVAPTYHWRVNGADVSR